MIRRAFVGAALLGLIAGAPGFSSPLTPRVAEAEYSAGGVVKVQDAALVGSYCAGFNGSNFGGACFDVAPDERYVTVEVVDDSGAPIQATIVFDNRPDVEFCGQTENPVRLPAGHKVLAVSLHFAGICGTTPSVPTTGTVTATFSSTR